MSVPTRLALCLALLMTLVQAPAVLAAAAPCDSDPERPPTRPVAPAALAAELPDPFTYRSDGVDRSAVLRDVVEVVSRQAAELGADDCYRDKPARIAEHVDFLSPFEFLVVTMFDQEPARRDELLDQYVSDPRGAIRALGEAFPSTRGQATLTLYAYFDVASGRIRVNAAKVPLSDLRRVLVHEFWHAMPRPRIWAEADGRTLRASGFWLQEQRAGRRVWVPVEDRRGLPYSSYLLDEGMATLMETRYAGLSPYARPEIDEVRRYLDRLMSAAGTADVLREYLESRPYQLTALTEAHRESFPELEPLARP
jgi:hypothetical protein